MIQLKHVNKRFGKKLLYRDFSMTFPDHGIIALTGPSGCGKTTLLRMIAGLDKRYTGQIEQKHIDKISYVFQEPRLLPDSDALENVALPLGNTEEARQTAARWLTKLGLEQDLHTFPEEMSGGMKQRVSIARAFAYDGELLILDEPFNGIDPERTQAIMDMILEMSRTKLCLLVTHNEDQLRYLDCPLIPIS